MRRMPRVAAPRRLSVGSPLIRKRTPSGACSFATCAPSLPRSSPARKSSAIRSRPRRAAILRQPPAQPGSPWRRRRRDRTAAHAQPGSGKTAARNRSGWKRRRAGAVSETRVNVESPVGDWLFGNLIAKLLKEASEYVATSASRPVVESMSMRLRANVTGSMDMARCDLTESSARVPFERRSSRRDTSRSPAWPARVPTRVPCRR